MHFKKHLLLLVCVAILPKVLFSSDVSVTLQNGLDGYTGCGDNHILDAAAEENKSKEKLLTAAN